MVSQDFKKYKFPDSPGVYYFKKGREVLYVGKATSLKDRVKSYFSNDLLLTRGSKIVSMIVSADSISYKTTDSVLEALILEAAEIKRLQPSGNSRDKDDKSFNYVVITKEVFPKVLIVRERELKLKASSLKPKAVFGPFTNGSQLKEALKIIRKMFPYRDRCELNAKRGCFNYQIGLCPGVCIGKISKNEYAKTIRHISLFFSGKKRMLVNSLKKEMMSLAKAKNFEKAQIIKKQIFALEHIRDVSLLKHEQLIASSQRSKAFRIEAYDVAHISGTNTVGVMTVVEDGEAKKNDYRKFKIRGAGKDRVNDTVNLKEILTRRFKHTEWTMPDLIVVDGSTAQINTAKTVLESAGLNIEACSVVKDEKHKAKDVIGNNEVVKGRKQEILLANSEAHRFAIGYHRSLRKL